MTRAERIERSSDYPEHDKLAKVSKLSQEIGEFLDFGLAAQGIHLAVADRDSWSKPVLVACPKTIPAILATYFEIDQVKIDAEKNAMLEALRNA